MIEHRDLLNFNYTHRDQIPNYLESRLFMLDHRFGTAFLTMLKMPAQSRQHFQKFGDKEAL